MPLISDQEVRVCDDSGGNMNYLSVKLVEFGRVQKLCVGRESVGYFTKDEALVGAG